MQTPYQYTQKVWVVLLVLFAFLGTVGVLKADTATSTEEIATSTEVGLVDNISTPTKSAPEMAPETALVEIGSTTTTNRVGDSTTTSPTEEIVTSTVEMTPVADIRVDDLTQRPLPLPIATSTEVFCTAAYTADLYDTPSGHLEAGYVLDMDMPSTTEITKKAAHRIGSQSWMTCRDTEGVVQEFKITPEEYAALSQPGAKIPEFARTKLIETSNTYILE